MPLYHPFSPTQRIRDWICEFFSSLPKLCDDPSDAVAAAVFSAIGALLQEHPLCVTAVDEELRRFWGEDGGPQQQWRPNKGAVLGSREWGGEEEKAPPCGAFGSHKQVCVGCKYMVCVIPGHIMF